MLLAVLLAVDAALQPFVKVEAAALALEHVRIIDGTGAPPREDQTLFIAGGKVVAQAPGGAQRIDLTGRTVMPGLVGMHEHLFYPLGAAIEAAHKRGLKVTAHLCSIGFTEAARLGIDDLEHGLLVDTEFFAAKKPDQCPNPREALAELAKMDAGDPRLAQLVAELVKRKVAITSTLAVFDAFTEDGFRRALTPAVLEAVSGDTRARLLQAHISRDPAIWRSAIKLEMAFERAFVEAGGLLMAGCDPTGNGAVLGGYGDWRDVELLVDAGFTPVQALKIHSLNGAIWLGQQDRIGSIAPGKDADLVVVQGDPSKNIADIEKVEIVFKQGVGYDSQKLFDSVRGVGGMG